MDSLSGRARLLVVAAFVLSAGLFATASVAYVVASRDDGPKQAGPVVHPSVIIPTQPPSATPTPTTAPTTSPSPAASPSPSASPRPAVTPSPSSSPKPATTSPRPSPTRTVAKDGLAADAAINIANGGTTADTYRVTGHATDGDGTIYLKSLDWGDGTVTTLMARGTACSQPAVAPADCRDYRDYRPGRQAHTFSNAGSYTITVTFVSGAETQVLHLTVKVSPAPTASPTHT